MAQSPAAKEMEKATATIGLFWNDVTKRWLIRTAIGHRVITLTYADTSRELDDSGLFLIASAVKDEMEAWLL